MNTSAQSSAERHIGPTVSWVHASAIAPYRLTRPNVGRMPVIPLRAAGAITEPPVSVEIHLTNVCNLRCAFCSYGTVRANEMLPQSMLDELVEDLIACRPTLKAVVFSGGGDPSAARRGRADRRHHQRRAAHR